MLAFCSLFQVSATLVTVKDSSLNITLIRERGQSTPPSADRHLKLVYFAGHYRILLPYALLPPRRKCSSLPTRSCATPGCQCVIAETSDQPYCSLCWLFLSNFDGVTENQGARLDGADLSSSPSSRPSETDLPSSPSSAQPSEPTPSMPPTNKRRKIPRTNTKRIPSRLG